MRALRHLFPPSSRRAFPPGALAAIADAITAGEATHAGQVCFAVESGLGIEEVLRGTGSRAAAEAAFARLRVWDTEANNGVLVYLLLADHRIEIVPDRGLAGRIAPSEWQAACAAIESALGAGPPAQAVIAGVTAVSALLAREFPLPPGTHGRNELPDAVRLID